MTSILGQELFLQRLKYFHGTWLLKQLNYFHETLPLCSNPLTQLAETVSCWLKNLMNGYMAGTHTRRHWCWSRSCCSLRQHRSSQQVPPIWMLIPNKTLICEKIWDGFEKEVKEKGLTDQTLTLGRSNNFKQLQT